MKKRGRKQKYSKDQKCSNCGATGIYAKNLCVRCYNALHRGVDLEKLRFWTKLKETGIIPEAQETARRIYDSMAVNIGELIEYTQNITGGKVEKKDVMVWAKRYPNTTYLRPFIEYVKLKAEEGTDAIEFYTRTAESIDFQHTTKQDSKRYAAAVKEVLPYIWFNGAEVGRRAGVSRERVRQWVLYQNVATSNLHILHDYICEQIIKFIQGTPYIKKLEKITNRIESVKNIKAS